MKKATRKHLLKLIGELSTEVSGEVIKVYDGQNFLYGDVARAWLKGHEAARFGVARELLDLMENEPERKR